MQQWSRNLIALWIGNFAGFIPAATALVATNTTEARVGRSLAFLGPAAAAGRSPGGWGRVGCSFPPGCCW